jgi:lysophospholipase L1-like esterase
MKNVEIFGDSIMKGIYYDGSRYRLCREKLEAEDASIRNRSKMGATISQGLKAIEAALPEISPGTVAILEFGGNDCNFNWAEVAERPEGEHSCATPMEIFEKLYEKAVRELQKAGATVVLCTLPPISSPKFFEFLSDGLSKSRIMQWLRDTDRLAAWQKDYSDAAARIARRCGCGLIDLRKAAVSAGWDGHISPDGLHPDASGHGIIRLTVEQYIENMI